MSVHTLSTVAAASACPSRPESAPPELLPLEEPLLEPELLPLEEPLLPPLEEPLEEPELLPLEEPLEEPELLPLEEPELLPLLEPEPPPASSPPPTVPPLLLHAATTTPPANNTTPIRFVRMAPPSSGRAYTSRSQASHFFGHGRARGRPRVTPRPASCARRSP
jgi:hypothetical protein